MTIRNKLILMLAIPIAALVLIAGVGFRDQSAQAEQNEAAQEIADSIIDLENLALRLADERLVAVRLDLATMSAEEGEVELQAAIAEAQAQASQIPQLLEQLDELIESTDAEISTLVGGGDLLASSVADEVAEDLAAAMGRERSGNITIESLAAYDKALDRIDQAIESVPLAGFSADAALAVRSIQSAREVVNSQENVWIRFFSLETVTPQDLAELTSGFDHVNFVEESSSKMVFSNGVAPLEPPASSQVSRELSNLRTLAKDDLFQNTPDDLTPGDVLPLVFENRQEWNAAANQAAELVLADIAASGAEIDSRRSLFTLFAVLGSLLLFTLIFVIGRSILGPLDRLIEHAELMTQERLPFAVAKLRSIGASDELPEIRPIPKETNDEIGGLVDAFNEVQQTAIKVATDQARSRRNVAEMFVSLGRRNQQLNHRMLNLISELEQDEQDPELLRGLYQLDHLATRMRRNAESLLVLAGNRSPRQWSSPVPIEDVVRSSLAEVELFERVEVGELPDSFMHGNVITDVTHLLAELLDNATQFSEPSTTVSISAHETLEGVEIEVFDEGFGVGEHDLAELNERITNPPALDEAPSRLLGLFVVGRLAQQHGIDVHLESQPGVGTVATVSLPSAMFPDEVFERARPVEPPVLEIGDSGDIHADFADMSRRTLPQPAPVTATEVVDEEPIPSWNPAALHDEDLADASVPTMDEMMEALPSFPGVTIEEPPAAAAVESIADEGDDTWPLARLEPQFDSDHDHDHGDGDGDDDHQTSGATITALEPLPERTSTLPAVSEMYAPIEEAFEDPVLYGDQGHEREESMVEPVAEPVVIKSPAVPAFEAPPAPDEVLAEELSPADPFSVSPLFNDDFAAPLPTGLQSIGGEIDFEELTVHPDKGLEQTQTPSAAASLPAPPTLEPSPLAAPPIPDSAPPIPEEPSSNGLPTRSPQAVLEASEETPELSPIESALGNEVPVAEVEPKVSASAFAAFASGVSRGLADLEAAPKPQYSNEGETNE